MPNRCGGCRGEGRHVRWCPWVVGAMASRLGQLAEQAEAIGDQIGPNNMGAANLAWQLSEELRQDALLRAGEYMAQHGTHH